ncbi:Aldo/keto reductase [Fragilariopsis cylindrus CCMP1102]|uniref:Aldo/keto reductase n=1 Tax=Fragilariopsis cylindrus CCMP1102 TaxID=635003 RepID=A0A1E7EZQ4_9STRA|nr:Aldo/keto reductase [Fragilariopsis cylindrus CCMP1102]|eukprot:OEU11432.1 Aldo/keto reductase [Fragilariopsis cylindrus CCMP1102]
MKIVGIILLIVIITIVRVLLGHEITDYNNLSSFSSSSSLSSLSPVSSTKTAVMIVDKKTEETTSTSTTSVSSSSSSSNTTTTTTVTTGGVATTTTTATTDRGVAGVSYRTSLAYGTKISGKDQSKTAYNVETAIQIGFRHIVTCGHHSSNNESGVGIGLQNAYKNGIERKDLFLQTCFVPFTGNKQDFLRQSSDPPEQELVTMSIEDQVHLSIKTSLKNLKTTYLDAYIFHNFRAKLYDTNEMLKAWKVFEEYVDQGIIKQLGLTSVHNAKWFETTFYNNSTTATTQMIPRIKPTIIQNRFHSNRQYDVGELQEIFHGTKYSNLQIQRFWILNGSSGGGRFHTELATKKGLSPAQLLKPALVGSNTLQHMRDDIVISKCYNTIFKSEQERNDYSKKLGMKQQPVGKQLPGSYNGGGSGGSGSSDNPGSGSCNATTE